MADDEWKQVIRLVHLDFGARALNGPGGSVDVYPTAGGVDLNVTIDTYADLFSELKKNGVGLIGAEFIQDEREKAGIVPPDWRVCGLPHGWVGFDVSQKWSQVASRASRKGEAKLADIASRLSFQLDACARSIFELSSAYHLELHGLCVESKFHADQIMQTQNSSRIFYAVNNYFMNAGILRDVVAEFLSNYVYAETFPTSKRPTSMAKLANHLRKGKVGLEAEFTELLLKMTSEDVDAPGWLAELSSYRNLIIHQMPLAMAVGGQGLIKTFERGFGVSSLPAVSMPIPSNAVRFRAERAKGDPATLGTRALEQLVEAMRDPTARDALTYCHIFDVYLSHLSLDILRFSPIEPKMLHFVSTDGATVIQDD